MNDLARELCEAHVQYELTRLRQGPLSRLIQEQIAEVFAWLENVKLNDIATRAQVMGVIERNVIELPVSGGITELAGQMSQAVFAARAGEETRVDEIFLPELYAEFADKVVALESARAALIKLVTQSSAFGTIAARVLSTACANLLFRSKRAVSKEGRERSPAASEGLGQELERRFGAAVARYLENHAEGLSREGERLFSEVLDDDCVRWIADEIWDAVSRMKLTDAFAFISAHDLEDFVVLGYEFWLRYRKTRYFRETCLEVVDRLFSKWGDESVLSLIEDMGVTEQMVTHELQTFVGPVFEHADRTGFVEQQIRVRLEAFYDSQAVAGMLARPRG
jgi:hypothetical protein